MIRFLKIVSIGIILLVFSTALKAQDLKEELIQVYQKFNEKSFRMNMEMSVYFWDTNRQPKVSTGVVKKSKENYYTKFDGQIKLKNSKYIVVVNKPEKQILYVVDNSAKENEVLTMMSDTNSLEHVILLKSTPEYSEYEVEIGKQGMKKMRMKITNKKVLSEVNYYYYRTEENAVEHVKIVYDNVKFNASFLANEFSEKRYFNSIKGEKILTSGYKGYSLVNLGN